ILRNAAFSLAAQLTAAAFTTFLTLYLVRALSTTTFGVFSLGLSIGALAAPVSDFGISGATARYVADHRTNPTALPSILSDALRLNMVAGADVSAGMIALADVIANAYQQPALASPLRVLAVAVFLQ